MVAKKKRTSKTVTAKLARDRAIRNYQFLYPVLINCELVRQVAEEEQKEKEPELFISAALKLVSKTKGLNVALCQFQAGEQVGELETLKVIATYYVALRADGMSVPKENSLRELLAQNAGVSAWPLFRTLFAQIVAQANETLPLLPTEIDFGWEELESDIVSKS
jgi:hypothetical protein